ncbi:MAG: hypothetical protein Q9216_006000 [Gyalolechia sp. 2 TL-2023]
MVQAGPAHGWLSNLFRRSKQKPSSTEDPHNETSSLLPKIDNDDESHALEESNRPRSEKILIEFRILLKGSIPVVFAYALQNSLQTVSVMIVGRGSPEDLATAAFAYMFAMATAWLIGLGGTTALDTLCSSSFTGSKDRHDLGVLLQRAFITLGLFYIPVVVLWVFSEPLFKALGEEEQLSRDSQIMRPGTYVLFITSPINAGLNFLFVYSFKMGLLGAPIATGISYWLSFLLLVAYARFVQGSECWGGWSRQCLQNMGTFSRLAALGVVHVGTEWWAFEIVALAAGRLGTISLAAQSVIMTADQVINTVPFGQGVAASARVGNLLGARNANGAARAANTAAWLSMLLGAVVLAILLGTRDHFAKIFNSDPSVVRLTAEVLPYVALFQIADGLNGSCGGSLRGMGRQHIGAAVNIVCYYAGALPLGIYLAFHGWGLKGLWVGQCIALYLVGFVEWIIVAFSNWDYQVKKAFERMENDEQMENGVGAAGEGAER